MVHVFNKLCLASISLTQATYAWPAVPYSALANRSDDGPLSPKSLPKSKGPASPPRLVLNGKASESSKPVGERRKNSPSISSIFSTGSTRSFNESQARSKQYEEDTGYALPPSLGRRAEERSDSPGMPLSPDPFGRFPSSPYGEQSPVTAPPERTSSLTNERDSLAPSSRFSVDSVKEDQQSSLKPNNTRSTLVSMKSIRKLWRNKNKSSISGGQSMPPSPDPSTMPSRPPSSATSLQYSEAGMSRTPSPSITYTTTLPGAGRAPAGVSQSQKANKRPDSGLDPFYFDQDPRYPSQRSPSPEANSQYQFPKSKATTTTTSSSPEETPQPGERKRTSVRKSLIRRKNGGSDAGSSQSESTGSVAAAEPRRRRPSLLDMAGLVRGSVSSLRDARSPSVPELPAEFRQGSVSTSMTSGLHSRTQSRSSLTAMAVLNSAAEREGASASSSAAHSRTNSLVRRKPEPQSSTDSSQESSCILTPVSSVAPLSFPKGRGSQLGLGRANAEDGEDAASFDESQFEIVSPRMDRFASAVAYAPIGVIDRDDL